MDRLSHPWREVWIPEKVVWEGLGWGSRYKHWLLSPLMIVCSCNFLTVQWLRQNSMYTSLSSVNLYTLSRFLVSSGAMSTFGNFRLGKKMCQHEKQTNGYHFPLEVYISLVVFCDIEFGDVRSDMICGSSIENVMLGP